MEHRGTARRRLIRIEATTDLPPSGTDVTAEDRVLGTVASVAGAKGLAMIRLERAREALDAGQPILAAGAPVTLSIPDWARFGWPEPAVAE
jgi:folate-binding Fe-S cluster repair protein YgfZ